MIADSFDFEFTLKSCGCRLFSHGSHDPEGILHNASVNSSSSHPRGVVPENMGRGVWPASQNTYPRDIVRKHGMMFRFYADDTQIYFSFDSNTPELVTVSRLEACVKDVSDWMSLNKLKLNSDKTEL